MTKFADLVQTRVINRATSQPGANHDSTEHNQRTQSHKIESSVMNSSSFAINSGSGSQFNNKEGNQNIVTKGTLIAGSTFNGEVHFDVRDEESRGKTTPSRNKSEVDNNSNIP